MQLIQCTATDGVRLDGILQRSFKNATHDLDVEVVLMLHGTGGNFYSSSFMAGLGDHFARSGVHVVRANTRGHDGVVMSSVNGFHKYLGAAFERVDDCRLDIAAWLGTLVERGYTRIVLAGHSLGAIKAIYSQAYEPHPAVTHLVAMSPPRLSHNYFLNSARAELFMDEFQRAQAAVEAGQPNTLMQVRFPFPYLITAAGHVDKYGPEERYDILRFVQLARLPMFFTYGSAELQNGLTFQGMPEELEAKAAEHELNLKLAIIAGADHNYTSTHTGLGERITRWLHQQPVAERRVS
jgi:pimeloyl-ACP methyl ester carboxylesterase